MAFNKDRTLDKFQMLHKGRILFRHLVNGYFKLIKSEKIFSQLCYGDYHRRSRKKASAMSQNFRYFRHNT